MSRADPYMNKQDDLNDLINKIQNGIKTELDSIESESMIDQYVQLKNSIQEEITKKFEGSKYVLKIKEIFEKNFEMLTDYFIRCQKHTETTKISVYGILINGMNAIKERSIKYQSSTEEIKNDGEMRYLNDEEFIFLVNALSSNIKDFFKNSKKGLGHMKSSLDTVIDQVLYCKSNISDMFLQLNNLIISPINPKYSQKPSQNKEKPFKEKLNLIMDKLDNINEIRTNISKDIKFLEQNSNKFYDEAKLIFKKLKQIHSDCSKNAENDNFDDFNLNTNTNFNNSGLQQHNNLRGRMISNSPAKNNLTSGNFNNSNILTSSKIDNVNSRSRSKGYDEDKLLLQRIEVLKKQNQNLVNQFSNAQEQLLAAKLENENLREIMNKSNVNNKHLEDINKNNNSRSISPQSHEYNAKNILRNKVLSKNILSKSQEHSNKTASKTNSSEMYINSTSKKNQIKKNVSIPDKKIITRMTNHNLSTSVIQSKNNSSISPSKTKVNNYINTNSTVADSKNEYHINNLLIKIAEMVISFVKQMTNLQESISKKVSNIKELKQNFEMNKRNIYEFANEILSRNKGKNVGNLPRQQIPKPVIPNDNNVYNNNMNVLKPDNQADNIHPDTSYNNPFFPLQYGNSIIKEEKLMTEGSINSNEIIESKENTSIKMKNSTSAIANELTNLNETYEKDKISFKKEINRLNEKLNLISSENANLKMKSQNLKDNEIRNKKLEEDNKNLIKDCRNLDSEIKSLNEKINFINQEKGELSTKIKNLKQNEENNQKEIKKLSQKITELNTENRNLILQMEELKRIDKEKTENIENISKNFNLKDKETKTFKETLIMLKKENEILLKENQEFNLAFENIQKNISEDQNRIMNEMKSSLEGFKDKETSLNSEIKTLKSNIEQSKKDLDNTKRDYESVKLKMEMKSQENHSLKEEMKSLRQLLKQNKENDSQLVSYTTQIENLENLVKRFGEDIEKYKKNNSELKSSLQDKQKIIEDLNVRVMDSEKSKNDFKTLLNEKESNLEEARSNEKILKERIFNLEKNSLSQLTHISELNDNVKSLNQKIDLLEKNEKYIQNVMKDKEENDKSNDLTINKLQDRISMLENTQKELEKQLNEKDFKITTLTDSEMILKKRIEEIIMNHNSLQDQMKEKDLSINALSERNKNLLEKTNGLSLEIDDLRQQIKGKDKEHNDLLISYKENIQNYEKEVQKLKDDVLSKDNRLNDLLIMVKTLKDEKEILISKSNNKISDLEEKILNLKNENEMLIKDNDNKEIIQEYVKKIDELERQETNYKVSNEDLTAEIDNQKVNILELSHSIEIEKQKNIKQTEEINLYKSKLQEAILNNNNLQTEITNINHSREQIVTQLDQLSNIEITLQNSILHKDKIISELEKKISEYVEQHQCHVSNINQLNEEIDCLKKKNGELEETCKKNQIQNNNLLNEIQELSKEQNIKDQNFLLKENELYNGYNEMRDKYSNLEKENKALIDRQIELSDAVNKYKNNNIQLIDIISLFNSANISLSNTLYGEDKNEDLLEIFSNLSNSLGIISDKSVQTQIISMMKEMYELFNQKVLLINQELTTTKNIIDNYSESNNNLEKDLEFVMSLLIQNEEVYCDKYKTSPYQKKNGLNMHQTISELIKYHHSNIVSLLDTMGVQLKEYTNRNNEVGSELKTLKIENADLNSQIELINEDIVGLKENSQNFLIKLHDIAQYLVNKINELGISVEKEIEIKNEELVLFNTIKTALPILFETIVHLRDKDEIDEENCIQVLSLLYRNNSFTLLLKDNEFIWKETSMLNLDSKGSGLKKHEEFMTYNIDKELEELNDLKEVLQAKEEECIELAKHLENLQSSDKNQYEEELERITNEFNDKLEKMDMEKQQFLEEKIKEMNDILATNQTEFDEEKEILIKNEKENFIKHEEALKKAFETEKNGLSKQFEEDKLRMMNEAQKKLLDVESNYRNIIKQKEDEYISLNNNFKNDLTTLKNQIGNKDSELIELRNNYSNLVNSRSKDSSELIRSQTKEIEILNKKLRECLDITIPSMQMEINTKKQAFELLDTELKKYEKENASLYDNLTDLTTKIVVLEKEIVSLKETKEIDQKTGKEHNDKIADLSNKNIDLIKEIKAIKNRMADLKIESEQIIEEKESELIILREEKEMFLTEKEKVEKIVQNILFTISVFDDNKNFSKIRKNFYENEVNKDKKSINSNDLNDEDGYSIYRDLDEITRIVENLHKKINELQKFESDKNEEKRTLEKKLEEMNKNAETKIKEYTEENKKLTQANEEYSKKIIEAIQSKAPHLLLNNTLNSNNLKKSDDIFKTIDLFKSYNEELSKMNSEFETKMLKAIEKAKKYKGLYNDSKSTNKSDSSQPLFYDPKKYIINMEKTLLNLKWFLLVLKKDDMKNVSYGDAVWVTASSIKEEMYEKIKDSYIDQTSENLKGIQEDLLDKLTRKEEEIITIKKERDTILRINSGQGLSKNTVPIEKFEFVLNQLNEESKNYRNLFSTYEVMKKENDILKQEIDNINNKSKLSKKNVSAIEKEFLSKFLDNDEEINNMFEKEELNQNTEQTKQSPKDHMNKSRLEEKKEQTQKKMNLSSVSQKETVHNFSMNMITKNKENEHQYERRMSQHSIKSKKDIIPTQGNDSIKDNLMKMEEEQKLFAEQLLNIKEELKETRKQKDNFKKLYEQCLTFKDEKKTEIVNILKQAFEKLIQEITITPKIKELIFVILKVIDYNEDQINNLIKKKENEKKGIFGGLFSKK